MFDFSRITEELAGLMGGQAMEALSVDSLIAATGLDPADLQGLDPMDLLATLSAAGIDVSALTESQISELLSGLGQLGADGTGQ